jgi:uncharacterized membrane protein (Fun14 family)
MESNEFLFLVNLSILTLKMVGVMQVENKAIETLMENMNILRQ